MTVLVVLCCTLLAVVVGERVSDGRGRRKKKQNRKYVYEVRQADERKEGGRYQVWLIGW